VWRRLFDSLAGGELFTRLLTAVQREVPGWDQPLGQNREGLTARTANPSSHPYSLLMLIVSLAQAQSMANDRVVAANGASPRQAFQRNYPGSGLSFASGSAITRITAGVKARRRPSPAKFRSAGRPSPSQQSQFQTKKEYCILILAARPTLNIGRLFSAIRKLQTLGVMRDRVAGNGDMGNWSREVPFPSTAGNRPMLIYGRLPTRFPGVGNQIVPLF
jgi:hypothetical protein